MNFGSNLFGVTTVENTFSKKMKPKDKEIHLQGFIG
jgi:hypothetical protein